MLTSIVVDHLWEKFQSEKNVSIAYIYLNFRRQQEQQPLRLLTSLLKQIAQCQNPMPTVLQQLHQRHQERDTRPHIQEITETLRAVLKVLDRCFVVVDALDEYDNTDGQRNQFLAETVALYSENGANVFATSRFIPEIERTFDGHTCLEIRASDSDIGQYLDSQLDRLPSFVTKYVDLQNEIKTEILKAVDGM